MSRLARSLDYVSGALRLLPPGLPGKSRLAKHLLGGSLRVEDAQLRDRFGCMFVVPSLLEPIGFHLLVDGVYEIEAINLVLSRVRTGSVFVDVGANIGVFTLPAARKVGPTGQVIPLKHPQPYFVIWSGT